MIVVAGESLIDLLVRPDGTVLATPGGGPFNTARALARLGVPVAFLGRLSTDAFGRILRDRLVADGVDLGLAPTTDDPTLLAVVDIAADGSATYRFHVAGSAAVGLVPGDLPSGLPPDTTALHVGTLGLVFEPIASTIAEVVSAAPPDALVMLDPNIRPAAIGDEPGYRARLAAILRRADVVKASTDDLAWLEPGIDAVHGGRRLLASGPRVVLVTDGPRPVRIVTGDAVVELPVPAVDVVDTVGAGDAFGAGFLAASIRGGHGRAGLDDAGALRSATELAIAIAAGTVTSAGADLPADAPLLPSG